MLFSCLLFGDLKARVVEIRCLRSKLAACRSWFCDFDLLLLNAFVYVLLRNIIFIVHFALVILVLVVWVRFRVELGTPVIQWVRSAPVKVVLAFAGSELFIVLFVVLIIEGPARLLVLSLLGDVVIVVLLIFVVFIVGRCLILGLFLLIRILLNFLMLSFANRGVVSPVLLLIRIFVVLFMQRLIFLLWLLLWLCFVGGRWREC